MIKGVVIAFGYSMAFAALIGLIVTFIWVFFHDFRLRITFNTYGEYYIELALFILGTVALSYALYTRITEYLHPDH